MCNNNPTVWNGAGVQSIALSVVDQFASLDLVPGIETQIMIPWHVAHEIMTIIIRIFCRKRNTHIRRGILIASKYILSKKRGRKSTWYTLYILLSNARKLNGNSIVVRSNSFTFIALKDGWLQTRNKKVSAKWNDGCIVFRWWAYDDRTVNAPTEHT